MWKCLASICSLLTWTITLDMTKFVLTSVVYNYFWYGRQNASGRETLISLYSEMPHLLITHTAINLWYCYSRISFYIKFVLINDVYLLLNCSLCFIFREMKKPSMTLLFVIFLRVVHEMLRVKRLRLKSIFTMSG